jgi:hypothetical protein
MLPAIAWSMSVSWLGLLLEQRRRRHDLSRLAVATLHDVQIHPPFAPPGRTRESLDRRYERSATAELPSRSRGRPSTGPCRRHWAIRIVLGAGEVFLLE